MSTHAYLEHGLTILKTRMENFRAATPEGGSAAIHPFITLSREACSGATTLGLSLLPRLASEFGEEGHEWVLLDKDLISYALARHELPEQLARYLPEDQVSEIEAIIGEIVGLHPSLWELEKRVAETILQLAHVGYFIFVGRAAHLLTQSLPGGFHVRLVAPADVRILRMMAKQKCDTDEAGKLIEMSDQARRRFVKAHFGRDIDDPHTYDLVINTGRISCAAAVTLVMEGLRHRIGTARGGHSGWTPGTWAAESEHAVWTNRE